MWIKKLLPFLIIFLFLIPLILPLLQSGFFQTDDGGWMVIRLSAFHETLKTGQFPVRFLERLNHGYGYPVLNFLYPLPFYLGEAIHLLGFSFVSSVKILFGASFIFGGFFMYLWAKKWGRVPGIVSAITYSYFIYRITDVYQRGSLGEATAFIFIPLVFWFLDKKNIPLGALSIAALICSHNSLALMFLPVFCIYSFDIKYLAKTILLALGVSAFFWLPAIYDLQFTKALGIQVSNFENYFLNPSELVVWIEIIIPIVLGIVFLRRKSFFWVAVTLVAVFLTLPISSFIWELTPLPRLIQFPWRFLAIPAFTLAALSGSISEKQKLAGIAICILFVVLGIFSLKVNYTYQDESYYTTNDDTTTVKNEYMPKWVKSDPTSKPESMYQIVGNKLQINKVYFPGIEVLVNGKSVQIDYQTNGLLLVSIPGSQDDIQVKFNETPSRMVANLISLVSISLAFILIIKKGYNMYLSRNMTNKQIK